MRILGAVPVLVAALLLPVGCGEHSGSWSVIADGERTEAQERQRARALAARDALFSGLAGRLTTTMAESGPAAAIAVCAEQAPQIAAQVSEEHDLAIGLTSV